MESIRPSDPMLAPGGPVAWPAGRRLGPGSGPGRPFRLDESAIARFDASGAATADRARIVAGTKGAA